MITVVGSLNVDFFIETARLPAPGETVLGHRFRRTPGGKGANQACAAARLGGSVRMIGCVGHDHFGRDLLANLAAFGVGTEGVITRSDADSGLAFIVVDDSGGNQIVVASGANASLTPDDVTTHGDLIRTARALIVQLEVPLPTVECALRIARDAGVLTVLNPAPATPLADSLLPFCDWLVPNELEAASLAGHPLRTPADAPVFAAALRQRAPHSGVLITLGAAGAWLSHGAESNLIPPIPVQAIDTVGAGDTFVGAFATHLTEGASAREAAEFAAAAAALAVTRRGAQAGIPTRNEVERLIQTPR